MSPALTETLLATTRVWEVSRLTNRSRSTLTSVVGIASQISGSEILDGAVVGRRANLTKGQS